MNEWRAFFELLMKQDLVACDTETSGFDYFKDDRICGLSFGWGKDNFYIPLRHLDSITDGPQPAQLDFDDIREDLSTFFAQEDVFTIWHNWKFDSHFYRADGIEIQTPYHDTRILWHFFDENAPGALKVISSGWTDMLGRKQKGLVHPDAGAFEKKIDKWRGDESRARRKEFSRLVMEKADELQTQPQYQSYIRRDLKKSICVPLLKDHEYYDSHKEDVHYGYIPIDMMVQYAGLDTFFTWTIYSHVMENMNFSKKLQNLYVNEIKLSRVIMEAEETGVLIDRDYLVNLGEMYDKTLLQMEKDLKFQLGDINFDSNIQLAHALLKSGVPLVTKTDSARTCVDCFQGSCIDHYKVDATVLQKFEHDYEIVQQVLGYRGIKKLRGTYVTGILDKLTEDDILHCSFNQNVKTGRMSSRDPNLQNIPGRDSSIRKSFVRPDGEWVYVFFDYSQVEVRLTAHYSQDPLLLDAYAKGQDVHTRTACEMFGYDYDEAIEILGDPEHPLYKEYKEFRNISKRINFGIIYGVGAPGLSTQIPRPKQYENLDHKGWVKVCQRYIDQYLDKYLGVKRFVNQGKRTVKRYGQVENSFGRIRHLPHAKACRILGDRSKYWLEGRAGRQGVNFLIQGDAADLFKTAAVRVHDLLDGKKSHIVNFVHDEIQLYMHKSELHLLADIKSQMEDFKQFSVPILVDVEYSSTNWAAKEGI
jgi:DNA polymerase-1